jgi:hypothetical protein
VSEDRGEVVDTGARVDTVLSADSQADDLVGQGALAGGRQACHGIVSGRRVREGGVGLDPASAGGRCGVGGRRRADGGKGADRSRHGSVTKQ